MGCDKNCTKREIEWLPVQDGVTEENMLSCSCENAKITTSCWITINNQQEDARTQQKGYPMSKTRSCSETAGRAAVRWQEGCNHNKIKFHTVRGVTHKLENNNTKKFSHCCEGSEPHVRLPSLGIWQRVWEFPGNLTLKTSGIWLQDFQRTGENRLQSWRAQNILCTKTQENGRVTPTETEPDLPASAGGSSVEAWVSKGSPQGWGR